MPNPSIERYRLKSRPGTVERVNATQHTDLTGIWCEAQRGMRGSSLTSHKFHGFLRGCESI